jgi:hypothetical protein
MKVYLQVNKEAKKNHSKHFLRRRVVARTQISLKLPLTQQSQVERKLWTWLVSSMQLSGNDEEQEEVE